MDEQTSPDPTPATPSPTRPGLRPARGIPAGVPGQLPPSTVPQQDDGSHT